MKKRHKKALLWTAAAAAAAGAAYFAFREGGPAATILPAAGGGTSAVDSRVAQARQLAAHLRSVTKRQEDKQLVARFQEANNLKVDGLYGPKTAQKIASFGVVPPTPFYWPRQGAAQSKKAWNDYVASMAQSDPKRGDAWLSARAV